MANYFVLVLCCLVLGVLRVLLPGHGLNQQDVFKDIAHLFVGGLYGAAFLEAGNWKFWNNKYGILAVALTVLEVGAFFLHN